MTRDEYRVDNSRVLTRVSSRTVICARELLSGPALSNEQNRITIHYGHAHAVLRASKHVATQREISRERTLPLRYIIVRVRK